ncbi:prepilin peptidase, partial [bacterium]|nr:prepilin peptidase [bacterium]
MEIILVALFGLVIGSFLNVVIYRTRAQRKIWLGRSACRFCKKVIHWFDNVPVLSSLVLRARCRACRKFFGWQYAQVELSTALLFLALFAKFGLTIQFGFLLVLTSFLILIFVYDLRWSLIPDRFSVPAIFVALAYQASLSIPYQQIILAGAIGGGFFLAQYILSRRRWIGSGDIRLGLLMGIILGWQMLLV